MYHTGIVKITPLLILVYKSNGDLFSNITKIQYNSSKFSEKVRPSSTWEILRLGFFEEESYSYLLRFLQSYHTQTVGNK